MAYRRLVVALALLAGGCTIVSDLSLEAAPIEPPEREQDSGSGEVSLPPPSNQDPPDAGAPRDATVPESGGDADAAKGPLRVFVTSTLTNGRFGGVAGADTRCNQTATAQGLGGKWVAWVSEGPSGPHAIDRVTSAGPWFLVTGEMVAATKAALAGGTLLHAIDRDEKGAQVPVDNDEVWTGTGPNGQYGGRDCDKWTTGSEGNYGQATNTNGDWTRAGSKGCGNASRLYCFEL